LRKQTPLAQARLAAFQQRVPSGFPVDGLFDRWEAAKRLRTGCRRQGWQVVGAIPAHRQLDAPQRSQWPQALRHQRYPRVQRAATDGRQRASLVRPLQGRRHSLSLAVCVLSSKRPPRDKPPQYCLGTDLSWSAPPILSIYPKRWPSAVDNVYVKQPLGWADLRGQSDEAPEKWGAIVFLALVFVQWRLPHAHAKEHRHSLADVGRQHRYDHARPLLETTGQEAAQLRDSFPVLKRFLCQPTSDGTKRQRPVSEREAP
jgi:hypothetical protein